MCKLNSPEYLSEISVVSDYVPSYIFPIGHLEGGDGLSTLDEVFMQTLVISLFNFAFRYRN